MRCPRRLLVVRWLPYKQLSTVKGVRICPPNRLGAPVACLGAAGGRFGGFGLGKWVMNGSMSDRLRAAGLTPAERVSLFLSGVFRYRPFWVGRKPNGWCECGSLGTHRAKGGDLECDDCRRKNGLVVHKCDMPFRLSAEEFEESKQRRAAYHHRWGKASRKLKRSVDNCPCVE